MKTSKIQIYFGSIILILFLVMAIFAPYISVFSPYDINLENAYLKPNLTHWFGTDDNGSDVWAKIAYGARISLSVSFTVVGISLFIGSILGSLAGYFSSKVDQIIMRSIDILQAFPGFLLALSCVAILGPSIPNLIIAMCISSWTSFARLVRAEFLHLKQKEFVSASKSIGASHFRLITFHIFPNILSPLLIQASFAMAGTIIAESSLSFLGLGAPPTEPSWGSLLNSGRAVLLDAPHISIFPGFAILLLVLAFNLVGDGLRDILDPRKQ